MTGLHVIVPDSIDDPARPSGGNTYDRRICRGLAAGGWSVHEHPVPGDWPRPDPAALDGLTSVLAGLADGSVVLLDGLIASAAPQVPSFARRLTLVVLVHMPLAQGSGDLTETRSLEGAVLAAAAAVITTSEWTRNWLIGQYDLEPGRVHIVRPGTDLAALAPGTPGGSALLSVAAVTPVKGHDLLVAALAEIEDLAWECVCVGATDVDAAFMARLRAGLPGRVADRIRFVGTRSGAELAATYAAADAVVLCSRAETYGMVVTEALARGIPVIATAVGGVPEALGFGAEQARPGILVPPDDSRALATALRRWLSDAGLRARLRRTAAERRDRLPGWETAVRSFGSVLARAGV